MAKKSRGVETDLTSSISGIPGTKADVEHFLAMDGKVLSGGRLPRYATGRNDGEAPEFPEHFGFHRGTGVAEE